MAFMEENHVNLAYGNNNLFQRSSEIIGVLCSNLSWESFFFQGRTGQEALACTFFFKETLCEGL